MEHFVGRHTIKMPADQEPVLRHYAIPAASLAEAEALLKKVDSGPHPATTCQVVGHVVDRWPVFDLLPT